LFLAGGRQFFCGGQYDSYNRGDRVVKKKAEFPNSLRWLCKSLIRLAEKQDAIFGAVLVVVSVSGE